MYTTYGDYGIGGISKFKYVATCGIEHLLWPSCLKCIHWFYTAQVHDQQLLVPPQYKNNDRTYPKPWDGKQTWPPVTSKESKQSGSHLCKTCYVWHAHDHHKSCPQGLATVDELELASLVIHPQCKQKLQPAKAHLATTRVTLETAADAADAAINKGFASVGSSEEILSPKYWKHTNKHRTKFKHDQGLLGTVLLWGEHNQPQPPHYGYCHQHMPISSCGSCSEPQ